MMQGFSELEFCNAEFCRFRPCKGPFFHDEWENGPLPLHEGAAADERMWGRERFIVCFIVWRGAFRARPFRGQSLGSGMAERSSLEALKTLGKGSLVRVGLFSLCSEKVSMGMGRNNRAPKEELTSWG